MRRAVPAAVALVALFAVTLIPLRVVGLGFRPPDDARRHAAKAISGKEWSEILVLRSEATVDAHPGWHALLGWAHRAGVRSAGALVVLSIIVLAGLFLAFPIFLREVDPEAWLSALLVVAIVDFDLFLRVLLGRPFVLTMAVLLAVGFLWPRLRSERPPWRLLAGLLVLFALSAWVHGNWYLWLLPVGCFLLAGELRVAARIAGAIAAGVAVGAAATGAPVQFLVQTSLHPVWAFGSQLPSSLLVGEFRPGGVAPHLVLAVAIVVVVRQLRGLSVVALARDPIFLLVVSGWALGLLVTRFRSDWGLPALLVWLTNEFSGAIETSRISPRRRLLTTCCVGAVLVLATTTDVGERWSKWNDLRFPSGQDPRVQAWLPEHGGVLYSNSMYVFYDGFFLHPHADWRYALGFEPALMTRQNLDVYREIHRRGASDASFLPWARQMRPEDRLMVVRKSDARPRIEGLEWFSPRRGTWIGRTSRGREPIDAADLGTEQDAAWPSRDEMVDESAPDDLATESDDPPD